MAADLALIVCFVMVSVTAVQSQIEKGPSKTVIKAGYSVRLECVASSNNCDQVDWSKVEGLQSPKLVYRNGQGMLNSDYYPPQRYSVNSTGGCSLTITQLKISDSGKFMCMQTEGEREKTRTSILVVINMTESSESCPSNVTNNVLNKGDGYSLWCSINVPAKSVEPSNVTLSFHDKTVSEIETTDEIQPLTVKTTLTGIATKVNITRRCRASFAPSTQDNYNNNVAVLNVCTTQWIVSYPVENIAVSPSGPSYYEGDTVRCTADGYPPPTFKWTHLKSGRVVDNNTLVINKSDAGENFTFTATNTFKGKQTSQIITIVVSSTPPPPPPPAIGAGGIVVIVIFSAGAIGVVVYVAGWKCCECWFPPACCAPFCDCLEKYCSCCCKCWENCSCWKNCICCKKCICWKICFICAEKDKKDEKADAEQPLTKPTAIPLTDTTAASLTDYTPGGPAKPPRVSDTPVPV